MRVIWISVGLLVVVAFGGFVMFEPEIRESLVASQQAVVENPFADDGQSNQPAKNDIDLATLPTDQSISNTNLTATTDDASVPGENADTRKSAELSLARNEPPIAKEITEPSLKASAMPAEPEKKADVTEVKKLGPSMLAFEKEKKKNKVAIIIHENNSQKLTVKEIKALYMDRLTRWSDGSRVMLYNLPLGDKYRDKFSKSVLKMTALEADRQESKRRELRIKANDVEVKAKNVVISYVEQHPNAVAYVPLDLVRDKSSVKVILTIP